MDTPIDPALEGDIQEVLSQVPEPIRAYFASGKVETVAKNLFSAYKLHVDQGAIVERELITLLLGLKDPIEFMQALAQEAGLDRPTISSIVRDVNEQIFIPVREQMRKASVQSAPQANPARPPAPAGGRVASAPLPPKMIMPPSPLQAAIQKALPPNTPPISVPPAAPFPRPAAAPLPAERPPQPPAKTPPPPPPKPYTVDPYREPIE